jgi:DNA-binding SARP family transcriptional activator
LILPSTRIHLCGRLVVEIDGGRLERTLPGRQGRLLFAYLVTTRSRPVPREMLLDSLWPEERPDAAEAGLRALVSKLRRGLGADRLEGRGEVRLALPPDAWIDVEVASDALHQAESAVALGEWARGYGRATVAKKISERTFLPGDDAPWVAERRGWLEGLRIRALEAHGAICLKIGGTEVAAAERSARELTQLAPLRESGYRLLIEVLVAMGNEAEAVMVYDRMRRLLRDELGIAPGNATQALYKNLLQLEH